MVRRFSCLHQGFIVVDRRYQFSVVMPWLLAEVRASETSLPIQLQITNRRLIAKSEASDEEVFSHDLAQVKRFVKSKAFKGMVAYMFQTDSTISVNHELHGFLMQNIDHVRNACLILSQTFNSNFETEVVWLGN